MAKALALEAHAGLYFLHKEEAQAVYAADENLDPQKLKRRIVGNARKFLDGFGRAAMTGGKAEVELGRHTLLEHVNALVNLVLRSNAICAEQRQQLAASKEAAVAGGTTKQQRGVALPCGSVELLLELRSRKFSAKTLGKKTKKMLRAEKRTYVRVVAPFIAGSPAMEDLAKELVAPQIASLRARIGLGVTLRELAAMGGPGGVLGALNEASTHTW